MLHLLSSVDTSVVGCRETDATNGPEREPLSFEWVTLQNGEAILDTRRTSIQTIGINPNETNDRPSWIL